jgi:DNA-binding MarR family transcriptional regulator
MRVFEKLRALTAFEKQHLPELKTVEDHHLIHEIGYHQAKGRPLTLKQLFLLDAGSIATVQRRLRRLKQLGVIAQRRSPTDRRAVELTLSPKFQRAFTRYGHFFAGQGDAGSRHVCSLYDSDAGRQKLAGAFLAEGLRRGERCIVVAPPMVRDALLALLGEKRRQIVASEGEASAEAQLAFYREQFAEAKAARQEVRVAGDVGWAAEKGLTFEELMRLEARLEPVVRQFRAQVLCLYDARRYAGQALLQALKQHRDTARLPILLA